MQTITLSLAELQTLVILCSCLGCVLTLPIVYIFLEWYRLRNEKRPNTIYSNNKRRPICEERCLPKRMILIRHGESEGNINHEIYRHVSDSSLHLTPLGNEQAEIAGKLLKEIIQDESFRFIISPYVRTIETFRGICKAFGVSPDSVPVTEEPRIREQDFGNFQDPIKIRECKSQRKKFGSFFFRFPSGESPADVFDRISSFLESLFRMFQRCRESNYILVTHGCTIRVILMRYFRYSVRDFEKMENPKNTEIIVLEKTAADHFVLKQVISPSTEASAPLSEASYQSSPQLRLMSDEMVVFHVHALEEQFLITPSLDDTINHVIIIIEQAYHSLFKNRPPLVVDSLRDKSGYLLPANLRSGDVLGTAQQFFEGMREKDDTSLAVANHDHIHVVTCEDIPHVLPSAEQLHQFLTHWENWQKFIGRTLKQYGDLLSTDGALSRDMIHRIFNCLQTISTSNNDAVAALGVEALQKLSTHDTKRTLGIAFRIIRSQLGSPEMNMHIVTTILQTLRGVLVEDTLSVLPSADAGDLVVTLSSRIHNEEQIGLINDIMAKISTIKEIEPEEGAPETESKVLSTPPLITSGRRNEILYLLQSKKESCRQHALKQLLNVSSSKDEWIKFTEKHNIVPELLHVYMNHIWGADNNRDISMDKLLHISACACSYSSDIIVREVKYMEFLLGLLIHSHKSKQDKQVSEMVSDESIQPIVVILNHVLDHLESDEDLNVDLELWIRVLLYPKEVIQRLAAKGIEKSLRYPGAREKRGPLLIKFGSVILDTMYSNDTKSVYYLIQCLAVLMVDEVFRLRLIDLGCIPMLVMLLKGNSTDENVLLTTRIAAKLLGNIASSSDDRKSLVLNAMSEITDWGQFKDNATTLYLEMIQH